MTIDILKRNIDGVLERIACAEAKSGRKVTLVAATKTVPAEVINSALGLGITNIGENRVQEFVAKRDAVKAAEWHFIGTLQRNKAKYLVGNVVLIQSVNSVELAAEIDRLAQKRGIRQDVLIEVNAAGEASKTGAEKERFDALVEFANALKNVRLRGIMSVPPVNAPLSVYDNLYAMYSRYASSDFDILSVGMSGDYEKAIECGSNMVRLGSAIFGRRQ